MMSTLVETAQWDDFSITEAKTRPRDKSQPDFSDGSDDSMTVAA
jgi:hypothetical protein